MKASGIHALVAAAAAALALGPAAHPHDRRAPAHGCDASGTLSAVICADPDLAARERAIAVLLPAARAAVLPRGPSAEDAAQRRFLKQRDACAGEADVHACLRNVYDYRAYDLGVAALFSDHGAAMPEIERHSSKAAEIYAAIYQYATIPDRPTRTNVVARTITPAFEALKRAHPGSILGPMSDAATAASSDEHFSTFLGAASAHGYQGDAGTLTLPCAALIRRPGLLAAMDERFGGAIDGWLPQSDCADVLPALPTFDRLVAAAQGAQPFCPGTIRFSLGQDYRKLLTAVRLHRMTEARRPILPGRAPGQARFIAGESGLIAGAGRELARYYAAYFGASPYEARRDGAEAARYSVSGAFHLCE